MSYPFPSFQQSNVDASWVPSLEEIERETDSEKEQVPSVPLRGRRSNSQPVSPSCSSINSLCKGQERLQSLVTRSNRSSSHSPKISRKGLPRIPQACEGCRIRKHRCNGEDLCERCSKKGIDCVYDSITPNERRRMRRELKKRSLDSTSGSGTESASISISRNQRQRPSLRPRFITEPPASHPTVSNAGEGEPQVKRKRRTTLSTTSEASIPSNGRLETGILPENQALSFEGRSNPPSLLNHSIGGQDLYPNRPPLFPSASWDFTWDVGRSRSITNSTSSGSSVSLLEAPPFPSSGEGTGTTGDSSLLFAPDLHQSNVFHPGSCYDSPFPFPISFHQTGYIQSNPESAPCPQVDHLGFLQDYEGMIDFTAWNANLNEISTRPGTPDYLS